MNFKTIRLADLKTEPGAEELLQSDAMQPYMALAEAVVTGGDLTPHIKRIAALPLTKKYVWRVTAALRSAFADYDTLSAQADLATCSKADLNAVTEDLPIRAIQLCLFTKALLGQSSMEWIVSEAIHVAGLSRVPDLVGKLGPITE